VEHAEVGGAVNLNRRRQFGGCPWLWSSGRRSTQIRGDNGRETASFPPHQSSFPVILRSLRAVAVIAERIVAACLQLRAENQAEFPFRLRRS
jgi:hypothetical protein